jgi:RNA recognition motif-containing protein
LFDGVAASYRAVCPVWVRTSVSAGNRPGGEVVLGGRLGRSKGDFVSKKLYVGNLAFTTTSDDLSNLFGEYGTVTSASVVTDRETGRSRGFGFVEMSDGADAAIQATNLVSFQGRSLTVNEAKPREDRSRSGSYGSSRKW